MCSVAVHVAVQCWCARGGLFTIGGLGLLHVMPRCLTLCHVKYSPDSSLPMLCLFATNELTVGPPGALVRHPAFGFSLTPPVYFHCPFAGTS